MFKNAPGANWFVYHHLFDRQSQIKYFSDGLDILVKYQKEFPTHKVLTVFLDTSGFNNNHSVQMFNQLLFSKLGRAIYTPNDLLINCGSTKTKLKAIEICGWPTLKILNGRIIFVLTSGDLKKYLNKSTKQYAFVASKPKSKFKDSVFMNIAYARNFKKLKELFKKKKKGDA